MFSESTFERCSAATRSLNVLVADDTQDVQVSVRNWLEELGHEVTCASSGNRAIQLLRERPVDLVITEVILPDGDGVELIGALRKLQPTARVIAFSGGGRYLSGADCLRVAKGLGANEVLMKPATRDEMLAAVARAMSGRAERERVAMNQPSAPQAV